MLKVIKQSLVSYTVETEAGKVVAWIRKVSQGYDVSLKDTLMDCYDEGTFQASFKEAKEYALQWAEGGVYDQNN